MIRKKALHIIVLSIAAMVVLLRPYAAYKITRRADVVTAPVKVTDILQSLLKKKREHRATIERETKVTIASPIIRLLFSKKKILFVAAVFKRHWYANAVFHGTLKNKPYLLLSRLQV